MYIKRKLNKNVTVFKGLHFPKKFLNTNSKRYKVTVGIGGNIGDVRRRFNRLLIELQRDIRVDLLQTSLILKNPPFGFTQQDDFFNSIIVLGVNQSPRNFLNYLMRLEKKFLRKRTFENAPRTLDLDIIFFDNKVINTNQLVIPHPQWSQRESVVIPLAGLQ